MKNWIIKFVINKVIKLAMEKADVTPYVEIAADAADEYLDKHMGTSNSQLLQDAVVVWVNTTVTAFTEKLKNN